MADTLKVRIVIVTNGKRWLAHGESDNNDSENLCFIEVECDPQWQTNLDRDMICVVEAEIPYSPNRVQAFNGTVTAVDPAEPKAGAA
jgi:hypothetical protein